MPEARLTRRLLKELAASSFIAARRWLGIAPPSFYRRLNVARVGTHEMFLDARDSLSLRGHPYEPFESELVQRLVRPGSSAVDIGANIGYYTLLLAQAAGPSGRVLAFEPDPTNHRLLRLNLRLNGYPRVRALRAALSDREDTLRLYLAHDNAGDHRLHDFWKDRESIPVQAHTLDSFRRGDEAPVDFIKMDVQGAEHRCLRGMEQTLRENPAVVLLTEYSPRLLAEVGDSGSAFVRHLAELGFHLHEIRESSRTLPEVSPEELGAAFEPEARLEGEGYTNLLCVRGRLPPAVADLGKPCRGSLAG